MHRNRRLLAIFLAIASANAQDTQLLRSTTRLVLAPVSVTDRQHRPVEGLTAADLVAYDNNVPIRIQMEDILQPLSLVIVVQNTASSQSMLDKLRKEAAMIGPLLTGERGEAAVITFGRQPRVAQDFTGNAEKVEQALRELDGSGAGGSLVDAVSQGLRLVEKRPRNRRRVMLLISEKHDRSSEETLDSLMAVAERGNATVYGLTFSPTKTVFASRAARYCDRKCLDCAKTCKNCGNHCDRANPSKVPSSQSGPMNLLAIFGELKRMATPDIPSALAKLTGGAVADFVRRQALEEALQRVGADLHQQYLISFPMRREQSGAFHTLRVHVKNRPELIVRTRAGYFEIDD